MIKNNREIIKSVSKEFGLSEDVVCRIYNQYFRFINKKISELKLSTPDHYVGYDEFCKLKTKFPILHIGYLYVSYDKMVKVTKLRKWKDTRDV